MLSFPIELKEILFLSDPNVNFRSEASLGIEALLVEGKEKTRAGEELLRPNV